MYVCTRVRMFACTYVVYLKVPIQECVHKKCAAAKKFKRVCMKPLKKYALSKIKRLKIKNDNKNYANNFRFLRTLATLISPCFWNINIRCADSPRELLPHRSSGDTIM